MPSAGDLVMCLVTLMDMLVGIIMDLMGFVNGMAHVSGIFEGRMLLQFCPKKEL